MQIIADNIYHIYNQGNNRQVIFKDYEDYTNFLNKVRKFVTPYGDRLAYCLMPNHFHFLINTTEKSSETISQGNIEVTRISNGFRLISSHYAQDFNKKYNQSGSLFRQKTKSKIMLHHHQAFICFQYIHQNPWKAGLVDKMEKWQSSSFQDYAELRNGSLCKKEVTFDLINLSRDNFLEESYAVVIDENLTKGLFK
jgi:REP element-mobilizing transposase RayT